MADYGLVTTTTDTPENAAAIAAHLLDQKLAACVQSAAITSSYVWKGQIQHANEIILTIKTMTSLYKEVESAIRKTHTYDTPEITMTLISAGSTDYLAWIENTVKRHPHHLP